MYKSHSVIHIFGGIAQLARAPALQAGGRRFESDILHPAAPEGRDTHIDIMTGETGAAAEAARPEKRRRQGRTEDALAPRGDEGRDKRRNSPARRKQPLTRGCPNGGTPPRGDTERWANAVN